MYSLEKLNDVQKQAVLETEGAVLVTAGAGSGKTRLLTHRIAHLIKELGVSPHNILAITFTNKAANEMRTRLEKMLGSVDGIWGYTFHGVCLRILRRYIDRLDNGFNKNFTIYGEAESKAVVKRICKENDLNDDMVKRILTEISNAKNNGISVEEYAATYKFEQDNEDIAAAYAQYVSVLKSNNALDFDDMLLYALSLLTNCDDVRAYYQDKFHYIHIDEFQDTNSIQYSIVKILAGKHGNIFAVGDEDQCIYTWRGATIKNIFKFKSDFNCKLYKLEQNYRSTANILSVANRVIKCNTQRLEKKLWTNQDDGEKVVCFCAATEGFEADFVVKNIIELVNNGECNYSDCAILFRVNALTRYFEERFLQYGIPHRVYGGFKFYDRKEIKDVLAYAQIAANPADDEALFRIINFPRRGIGATSIDKIRLYSKENNISAFDIIMRAHELPFPSSLKLKLQEFGVLLSSLRDKVNGSVKEFFKYLLYDVLNIINLFSDDDDEDGSRLENIKELLNSIGEFARNNYGATVSDYLQTVSLYSDTDEMNDDNCVTLATVHSAKGLEFPVVFVVGLEDGIFPSLRQNENQSDHMEEERRLMYVAVTRAQKRLFLTYAKSRFMYGETKYSNPSRFLSECGLVTRPQTPYDTYTNSPSHSYMQSPKPSYKPQGSSFGGGSVGIGGGFSGAYKSDFGKTEKTSVQQKSDKPQLAVGMSVMHKRLGKGKIIGIEKMGESVYAKIDFERGGVMLLAVDFAPITVIND